MSVVETYKDLLKLGIDPEILGVVSQNGGTAALPRYIVVTQTFSKGGGWTTSYTYNGTENGLLSKPYSPLKLQTTQQVAVTTSTGSPVYSNWALRINSNLITATINSAGVITLSATPSAIYSTIEVHSVYLLDIDETCNDYQIRDIVTPVEVLVSRQAVDVDVQLASGLTGANVQEVLEDLSLATINAVSGPASATNLAIAIYDQTTGKLITNSALLIDIDRIKTQDSDSAGVINIAPGYSYVGNGANVDIRGGATDGVTGGDVIVAGGIGGTNNGKVILESAFDKAVLTYQPTGVNPLAISTTDFVNTKRKYLSAGIAQAMDPVLTDAGGGYCNIAQADVYLYSTTDFTGNIEKYTVAATNGVGPFDNTGKYLSIDYNGGTPIWAVKTSTEINSSNIVPIYKCWYENGTFHSLSGDGAGLGLANKISNMLSATRAYTRAGEIGLKISESATRIVNVSSALVYAGTMPIVVGAYTSTSDILTFVYHVGGVWTYSNLTTQYNNTQYDDGTDLVTMPHSNDVTINWIYRSIGDVKECFYVLGNEHYEKIADAKLAQPRTDLPNLLKQHCILVGRIIVENGATSGLPESAFDLIFQGSTIIAHNDLETIQGGTSTEKYHLDQTIYNGLVGLNDDAVSLGQKTHMATGVPWEERGKFKVTVSYNAGNLTASIVLIDISFVYYINNVKYTISAANVADFSDTQPSVEGVWFFYINQNNNITLTKTPWAIYDPDVLLWNFYFNASDNVIEWVGEERHTAGRDIYQHARNHSQGAVYRSGLIASQYNGLTVLTNADNNLGRSQLLISSGIFFDEDIRNSIAHSDTSYNSTVANPNTNWALTVDQFLGFTEVNSSVVAGQLTLSSIRTLQTGQALTVMQGNTTTVRGTFTITAGGTGTTFAVTTVTGSNAFANNDVVIVGGRFPIYYYNSTTTLWRKLATSDFPVVVGSVAGTTANILGARISYCNPTGATFTECQNGRYVPMYAIATNSTSEPIILVCGQDDSVSATLATALGETAFQFQNLQGLNKLEFQEVVPFYRFAFLSNTGQYPRLADATFLNLRVTSVTGTVIGAGSGPVAAAQVSVDATNFDKILSATDTDVQTALETLDELAVKKNVNAGITIQGDNGNYYNLRIATDHTLYVEEIIP